MHKKPGTSLCGHCPPWSGGRAPPGLLRGPALHPLPSALSSSVTRFSISTSLVFLVLWCHSDTTQVCATLNLERSPCLQVCVPNAALLLTLGNDPLCGQREWFGRPPAVGG